MASVLAYILPVFPLASTVILLIAFRSTLRGDARGYLDALPLRRLVSIALAGFSYAALVAVAFVSVSSRMDLELPVYYLLTSFLAFYLAHGMQSDDASRWRHQLADGFLDVGSLSMILSAVSVIALAPFSAPFRQWVGIAAFALWYLNHIANTALAARALSRQQYDDQSRRQTRALYRRQRQKFRRSTVGDALWYLVKGYKSE